MDDAKTCSRPHHQGNDRQCSIGGLTTNVKLSLTFRPIFCPSNVCFKSEDVAETEGNINQPIRSLACLRLGRSVQGSVEQASAREVDRGRLDTVCPRLTSGLEDRGQVAKHRESLFLVNQHPNFRIVVTHSTFIHSSWSWGVCVSQQVASMSIRQPRESGGTWMEVGFLAHDF